MDITRKNKFIVANKKDEHFEKDRELFLKVLPHHKLAQDLQSKTKVNKWNRHIYHGHILSALLDKVSEKEILENRNSKVEEKEESPTVDYNRMMEISAKFSQAGIELTDENKTIIFNLCAVSEEEVEAKIEELKPVEDETTDTDTKAVITVTENAETVESTETAPEAADTESTEDGNDTETESEQSETNETEESESVTDTKMEETTTETTAPENAEAIIESKTEEDAIGTGTTEPEKKSVKSKKSSQA